MNIPIIQSTYVRENSEGSLFTTCVSEKLSYDSDHFIGSTFKTSNTFLIV